MPYYRSNAYKISQGFQKVLIYYFMIFILITMNFQNSSFKSTKIKEKQCKSCIGVPAENRTQTSAKRSFGHYLNESTVSHLGPPSSSNSCLRSFAFLLHRVGAEEAVGEDQFKQPGWPAVAEEGHRGRPRPWLALDRPKLATGSMAMKLPWAAMAAGQYMQQRHGR